LWLLIFVVVDGDGSDDDVMTITDTDKLDDIGCLHRCPQSVTFWPAFFVFDFPKWSRILTSRIDTAMVGTYDYIQSYIYLHAQGEDIIFCETNKT
jgi:hypothetical protein